jgi:hypothetical protein
MFVLGYPVPLLEALSALAPLPSTITDAATADFYVDEDTGETVEAQYRAVYNGSAEAQIIPQDSGRFTSTRVDATAAINAGIINLILPRRFDVPPAEGGFVISEPVSFRDAIANQFEGIEAYCTEIQDTLPNSDTRQLQIAVNKLGYINSIAKNSIPGRAESAKSRAPSELNAIGEAVVNSLTGNIISLTTEARDAMLSNAPGDPGPAEQTVAEQNMEQVCNLARIGQAAMAIPPIQVGTPEPEIPEGDPHCYVEYELEGTFQIADTTLSAGDATFSPPLPGRMIAKYVDDGAGNIVPGRVEMMWIWVHQDFLFDASPPVLTDVHNFSPTCNGESQPAGWDTVAAVPAACAYESAPGVAGTVDDLDAQNPIAIGELVVDGSAIEWQSCSVDPTAYWTDDTGAYTEAVAAGNTGRGCIALKEGRTGDTGANSNVIGSEWHSYGVVECQGSNALCKAGNLTAGANPQAFTWPQPLLHGTSINMTMKTGDSIVFPGTNPTATDDDFSIPPGRQSINIPNSSPSTTWMGITGARVDGPLTTCNAETP